MAYLFRKDNVAQSLRLGFAGAWSKALPDVQEHLDTIQRHYPQLLDSFLPPSERTILSAVDDSNTYSLHTVQQDTLHANVNVDLPGFFTSLSSITTNTLRLH